MVSEVVNEVCLWAKEHVVGFSFSLPTIDFELGQSMKSVSDDLGDWKSKLTSAKEKFQVRRHLPVCDSFLNWFLPGRNHHKSLGKSGD
jgi:hypothetical protein